MKLVLAKALQEYIAETTSDDCELREAYSGRGMYGGETAALVVDNKDVVLSALLRCPYDWHEKIEQSEELADAAEEFEGFREDNMGRDQVVLY